MTKRIKVLGQAELDLLEGFNFYEAREQGLGSYFLRSLFSDIESLQMHSGVHRKVYKQYHRMLCKRFPFAVFYTVKESTVFIHAILDCRREPGRIRDRLNR